MDTQPKHTSSFVLRMCLPQFVPTLGNLEARKKKKKTEQQGKCVVSFSKKYWSVLEELGVSQRWILHVTEASITHYGQ